MAKNGFKLIDAEMHVMEPVDLWERYIDPECQRRRENASAGRSKNASRMDARRPPAGGFFCFLAVDVGKDGWQCL